MIRIVTAYTPAGDVLLKFSDPPEAQVFDFTLRKNVPNTQTKLTPWGGHILFRKTYLAEEVLLPFWTQLCESYGAITNDEQCLIRALEVANERMDFRIKIGPLNPYFIVHTPEGRHHGKPTAAEGWL